MFKNYLRIQPAPVQLIIFLTFWFVLMMLSAYLSQVYIISVMNISAKQLPDFLKNDMYKYPNVVFVSNALNTICSFLLPSVIYAYLADPGPAKYLGGIAPGRKSQVFWVIILAFGLLFFMSPVLQWIKELDLGAASRALDEQREKFITAYLKAGNGWEMMRSLFLLALLPAICEEVFFRGMIMKFAQSILKKWWASILLSALLFTAFHASISEFVPICVAGIVLGMVYYLTSSIWMNILLHFLFNGLGIISSVYSDLPLEKTITQPGSLIAIFVVAGIVVGFCLFMLNKARTPLPAGWSVVFPEKKEQEWDLNA